MPDQYPPRPDAARLTAIFLSRLPLILCSSFMSSLSNCIIYYRHTTSNNRLQWRGWWVRRYGACDKGRSLLSRLCPGPSAREDTGAPGPSWAGKGRLELRKLAGMNLEFIQRASSHLTLLPCAHPLISLLLRFGDDALLLPPPYRLPPISPFPIGRSQC